MSSPPSHPTPYPEVNAVLRQLLSAVRAVLEDNFVGLYLYGSLATGDFDPDRSDIDFVVATAGELPAEMVLALEQMHARLASGDSKWAAKLEGSYIPLPALRRYDPDDPPRPQLNEGRFYVGRHESDWVIQRHVLREYDVAVAGPAVSPFIAPVGPDDLRRAVRGILSEWWEPMLRDPSWLRGGEYQAYAVLTMCRALYTLRHGTVASKPISARWAREALVARWTALIERSLTWQRGESPGELSETLALIRYTIERSRQFG
ncbi:MAG TPA: aminoglycoside adenylyltransferase domain-containing protein [Pyrinomonadaceae bacterium]|nr:aminoglycoside adenylyltransferase domain-containing protein [Pyrinomonadaceae bacterium]